MSAPGTTPTTTPGTPGTQLSRPMARLRHARRTHAARARLCAELSEYRTGAERAELAAVLSRHTEAELEELAVCAGRTTWS